MSVHIVPRKTYFAVFGALIFFTALTVIVASMFFWLLILLLITLTDYTSRNWFGSNAGGIFSGL